MDSTLTQYIFGVLIAVLGWLFLDNRKKLNDDLARIELQLADERRQREKLEAQLRELENEKFSQIMNALADLNTKVAVIQTEITEIKSK
jgi:cbb3-type cytochrome oxidase subunit 3